MKVSYFLLCSVQIAALIVAHIPSAAGWWQEGHLLTAQIAYSHLPPDMKLRANALAKIYTPFFPKTPDFVSCSVWPDQLDESDFTFFSNWHYLDDPYRPHNNTTNVSSEKPFGRDNVVYILKNMPRFIKEEEGVWQAGFAIRMVAHLMGDIHQPLHNCELIDANFPHGDRGGNLFYVKWDGGRINLHAWWDSAGMWAGNTFNLPLNKNDTVYIQRKAEWLVKKYGAWVDPTLSVDQIHQKYKNIAIRDAYLNGTLAPEAELSDTYIAQTREVAQRAITEAGLSLAHLLHYYL